jgi:polysaccharide export outer membrane protein
MKMKRILVGLATLVLAAAAAAQSGDKLGIGDAVHITVFQQPDLTTDARIADKGTVTMPLIGEVKIAGLTPSEAGHQIATTLKSGKYLNNPQVSVALTTLRSRQVSVLGMVARPGRYALDDTSSKLADVIAAAGGLAAGGADIAAITRGGETQKVDILGKPFELKNGDIVYIERAPVYYVYGEVPRAGAYRLEPNMTVMQAISVGGGITPRGSERRVKLRRAGPDGKVIERDAKLQDTVQADDVIFVKEALF